MVDYIMHKTLLNDKNTEFLLRALRAYHRQLCDGPVTRDTSMERVKAEKAIAHYESFFKFADMVPIEELTF